MTPELIERMATQAGFNPQEYRSWGDDLAKFAALVAAHQRELDAKVCDVHPDETGWNIAKGCAAAIRGRGE